MPRAVKARASAPKIRQGLRKLQHALDRMTVEIAEKVAKQTAPLLTEATQSAYDSGRTVYGPARPLGVTGDPLDLKASNLTRNTIGFTATGTVVRASLGTKYAKYLIGKYKILPNGRMPASWEQIISEQIEVGNTLERARAETFKI